MFLLYFSLLFYILKVEKCNGGVSYGKRGESFTQSRPYFIKGRLPRYLIDFIQKKSLLF